VSGVIDVIVMRVEVVVVVMMMAEGRGGNLQKVVVLYDS
jgi:hypothetical protein